MLLRRRAEAALWRSQLIKMAYDRYISISGEVSIWASRLYDEFNARYLDSCLPKYFVDMDFGCPEHLSQHWGIDTIMIYGLLGSTAAGRVSENMPFPNRHCYRD